MVLEMVKDNRMRPVLDTITSLIHQYTGGAYFKIYAIPRAKKLKLVFKNNEFLLYVNENCKHHKVNYAILKFFNKIFKARVRMLHGWSDRVKIIGVEGLSTNEVSEILAKHICQE
jgi:uncharacterized protein YggU (UPF0235/DUF167 family)